MIRIISGTYGGADGLKTVKSPPFSLTDAEEARLVNRGVAEYVYEQTQAFNGGVESDSLAYDISMTEKQLRGFAAYHGIDVSKIRGKKNIVAELDRHFGAAAPEEDDEEPENDQKDERQEDDESKDPDAPVLGAAAPEV